MIMMIMIMTTCAVVCSLAVKKVGISQPHHLLMDHWLWLQFCGILLLSLLQFFLNMHAWILLLAYHLIKQSWRIKEVVGEDALYNIDGLMIMIMGHGMWSCFVLQTIFAGKTHKHFYSKTCNITSSCNFFF